MSFIAGLMVGLFLGLCMAVAGHSNKEKRCAQTGLIEIDGKIYRLKPINSEYDNDFN